jgi:hypothetical protein
MRVLCRKTTRERTAKRHILSAGYWRRTFREIHFLPECSIPPRFQQRIYPRPDVIRIERLLFLIRPASTICHFGDASTEGTGVQ